MNRWISDPNLYFGEKVGLMEISEKGPDQEFDQEIIIK